MMIGNRSVRHGDALSVLGDHLDALPEVVNELRRVPLGVYRGLRFGMVLHPQFSPELYLQGASCRRATLSRNQGPRAVLNALENLAGSYERECTSLQKENTISETQLRDYQARLGNLFPHARFLDYWLLHHGLFRWELLDWALLDRHWRGVFARNCGRSALAFTRWTGLPIARLA